jgi:hypothetical protein
MRRKMMSLRRYSEDIGPDLLQEQRQRKQRVRWKRLKRRIPSLPWRLEK